MKILSYEKLNENKLKELKAELVNLQSMLPPTIGELNQLLNMKNIEDMEVGKFYSEPAVEKMINIFNILRKQLNSVQKQFPTVIANIQLAVEEGKDLAKVA